jgi:hypothetical protein
VPGCTRRYDGSAVGGRCHLGLSGTVRLVGPVRGPFILLILLLVVLIGSGILGLWRDWLPF